MADSPIALRIEIKVRDLDIHAMHIEILKVKPQDESERKHVWRYIQSGSSKPMIAGL